MPISDIANIAISVSGAGPTQAGFGEPLIAAYHTHYTDRVREYASLSDMASDGFAVTDPAYLAAQAVFSQVPSPPFVKVGRRALPYTQTLHLQCLSSSASDVYTFSLRTPGGSWHDLAIASTGVPTVDSATLNTAVTALAIPSLTATHSTDTLILTMAAGKLLDVKPDLVHMAFSDVTTDPGIATDLTAIVAADPAWYGLLLDSQSSAEIQAAAAWVQGQSWYELICNNSDTAIGNPGSTTDVAYLLKQSAYSRTGGLFSATQLLSYSAAGWVGRLFPTTAGSENWAFKTIAGVPVDALTTGQIHAVENKNWSVYTTVAGLNLTQFGKTADGEWLDITRGRDALQNAMQVGILSLLANRLKVPFTDAGVDMYRNVLLGVLKQFVDIGFLSDNPAPFVSLPVVANVTPANKAARNLPLVSFSATLAGAINTVSITGVLTS